MKSAQPRDLDRRKVARLLSSAKARGGNPIETISGEFLGRPYKVNPLIGSADEPEVFTAALDGFDCVTYLETVIALARARSVNDFVDWLRKIRYERGTVRWDLRNHYMTEWIRNNCRRGLLRPIRSQDPSAATRTRVLDVVPGLPALRARMRFVPKPGVPRLARRLESGDLIFFVSTRRNLDVFHAGIIVRDAESRETKGKLLMRHASRSKGRVVEQELREFLKANRMAGVMVMRPRILGAARRSLAA